MPEPVTLQNCEQEPIHIPGSIQPHGVLLALDPAMSVLQVSRSSSTLLGIDPDQLLGQPLRAILNPDDADAVYAQLQHTRAADRPTHLRTLRAADRSFDAIAHQHDDVLILELEPVDAELQLDDVYGMVQRATVEFRSAANLPQLADRISEHIRRITGFDRVMVYRFDPDWNGQVIAERKRDDLEPFLGLNYPASDIPAQARELYRKNWLRFIADRDYTPAPVQPVLNPLTQRPLDMSFAVLRSVSPIHLEYLRNMGVGASMSISLVCDDELWGLIACHHYSPRRVPYKLRTACELLGQVMSLQVIASAAGDASRERDLKQTYVDTVLERFDPTHGLSGLLERCATEITSVLGCTGVATISDGDVVRAGQCPPAEGIRDVARAIRNRRAFEVFSTDTLRDIVDSGLFDPIAAGVIAISLSADGGHMLLGFRPERLRTVNWAGDPAKSVVKGDGQARLSPRGSFALWKQVVEGRSNPFTEADHTAARMMRQRIMERLVAHADEIRRHNQVLREHGHEQEQRLESERAARMDLERLSRLKDDFVATLSHELRTPLNAIQGWTELLRSGAIGEAEMGEALTVIERNTRVQTQMIEDLLDMSRITSGKMALDVQTVDLAARIDDAIATVKLAAEAKRITIHRFYDSLDDVVITGDPNRLQQVLWNLLSNAVKFSPKGGQIRVELSRINSHIEISVRDNGIGISREFLPYVFERFRQGDPAITRQQKGLGLGLAIVRNLVELHGGTVSAHSPGLNEGSVFVVTLPVRALKTLDGGTSTESDSAADPPATATARRNAFNLAGLNLLIVEDEPDSRELLKRVLERHQASVCTAGTAMEALAHLYDRRFDVVVSDIGLPTHDGCYLIEQLRELEMRTHRGRTPAIAVTAYARAEDRHRILSSGFQLHLAKPADPSTLCAAIASVAGRNGHD